MKPLLFSICLMALVVGNTPRAVSAENNPDEFLEFLAWFYSDEDFQQEHIQYPLLHIGFEGGEAFEAMPYSVYGEYEDFSCILEESPSEFVQLSDNAIKVQVNKSGLEYYHYFRKINEQWLLFDVYSLNPIKAFENSSCDDNAELQEFVHRFYSDLAFCKNHTLLPILVINPFYDRNVFYECSKEETSNESLDFNKYTLTTMKHSDTIISVDVCLYDTDIYIIAVFRFIDGQWYYTDTICQ